MPALPWKSFAATDADREYLVMASALPLRRLSATVRFFRFVRLIQRQLASADGLIGYSLWAKPFAKSYWTLSVWQDSAALRDFMRQPPHIEAMSALRPHMAETHFVQWDVSGAQTPVGWNDALAHLRNDAGR